jgi:hypothetical protein
VAAPDPKSKTAKKGAPVVESAAQEAKEIEKASSCIKRNSPILAKAF